MSINKLALIRYKTIDNCLQNRYRKWTLDDLVAACSEAVYEYEGIAKGVSRRTVQMDLQNMRSSKLGYNAPIVVNDKKYYSYEEKGFSITNTPLTQQDLGTLTEVLGVLQQFKGFGYFEELNGMVTRLEDKLIRQQQKGKSFIEFEKNELLRGLNYIDPLHKAITGKKVVDIAYQSFRNKVLQQIVFSPWLLKEYRNRWFVLGAARKGKRIMLLALDRIEGVDEVDNERPMKPPFDVTTYFADTIGVSKAVGQKPVTVVFKVIPDHVPYVATKPLHHTQTILKEEPDGTIFSVHVIWNFELERELLGFGEFLRVLGPRRLVAKMMKRMQDAMEKYARDIPGAG